MPTVQDTYLDRLAPAYLGMVANIEQADIISRTVGAGTIKFGVPVVKGASQNLVINTESGKTIDDYVGVSVRSQSLEIGASPDEYKVRDTIALIRKGVIWVTASVAVSQWEKVYFVPATGVWTNVSTSNVEIPGAKFELDAGAAALVPIRLV